MRIRYWSSDVCSSDLFDPRHFVEDIVAQGRPVELAVGHLPAETAGIGDILGEMGAVDEQFLGHATANDAGAANLVLFGDRHPGAVGGGNARGTHAARTRADDEKVVIELLGHSASPNARSIKALVEGEKSNA